MKIVVLYGSKPSSNSLELAEAAVRLGHTVVDAPTEDVSSWVSNEGSRFWVGREEVTDADICLLRSYGGGSCEQITRRISLLEHMEFAGIKVIKAFTREGYEIEKFSEANYDLYQRRVRIIRDWSINFPLISFTFPRSSSKPSIGVGLR